MWRAQGPIGVEGHRYRRACDSAGFARTADRISRYLVSGCIRSRRRRSTTSGWATSRGRWTGATKPSPTGTRTRSACRSRPIRSTSRFRFLTFNKGVPRDVLSTIHGGRASTSTRSIATDIRSVRRRAAGLLRSLWSRAEEVVEQWAWLVGHNAAAADVVAGIPAIALQLLSRGGGAAALRSTARGAYSGGCDLAGYRLPVREPAVHGRSGAVSALSSRW